MLPCLCRSCTQEGRLQDPWIIEDAVSLMSSPSLPRLHSRPYTPLKYSPQDQGPTDSQPPVQSQRSQHSMTTNALWQSSTQVQDRMPAAPDCLTISCDSSESEQERGVSSEREPSHKCNAKNCERATDSKGRKQKHHRGKQRSTDASHPGTDPAALKAEESAGHEAPAYAGPAQSRPAQSSVYHALPFTQHAGMPGSGHSPGHSLDWALEPSPAASHARGQHQHSIQSTSQLQSELQHAQAAELHYLASPTLLACTICQRFCLPAVGYMPRSRASSVWEAAP